MDWSDSLILVSEQSLDSMVECGFELYLSQYWQQVQYVASFRDLCMLDFCCRPDTKKVNLCVVVKALRK